MLGILTTLIILYAALVLLVGKSAIWDDMAATGVPRRFGMTALFAMMTLYAVVFSVLKSLDASPTGFTIFAVFLTGVGAGQAILFGGKFPRTASVCVGAVLFPVEITALIVSEHLASQHGSFSIEDAAGIIGVMIFCIPVGGFLGYFAGVLAGGVFVLLDLIAKGTRRENDEVAEES